MRVLHFMTIDMGTGPVSLVELHHESESVMLRIVHNAKFDAVKVVDIEATRAYVAGVRGAKYMCDVVAPEHDDRLNDEIGRHSDRWGIEFFRIRWDRGRHGKVLSSRSELEQYDAVQAGVAKPTGPAPNECIMA